LLNWYRRLEYELILILDDAEDAMEYPTRDSFIQLLKAMRRCSECKIKFLITSRRSDIHSAITGLNIKGGAVSSIFSITVKSQKTHFYLWKPKNNGPVVLKWVLQYMETTISMSG